MRIIKDVIEQISHSAPGKTTQVDELLNQELSTILDSLLASTDDISAAIISSVDGLSRAQRLTQEMDEHRFAAMSSALLALSDNLAREGKKGQSENLLIEGSHGKIFILHASPNLLLTVFTRQGANLGMSLAYARQATEEISALVEAID
jgi:predicted regulator of Ras-like GTPase activity (Roadblock/LC7/MglB family)